MDSFYELKNNISEIHHDNIQTIYNEALTMISFIISNREITTLEKLCKFIGGHYNHRELKYFHNSKSDLNLILTQISEQHLTGSGFLNCSVDYGFINKQFYSLNPVVFSVIGVDVIYKIIKNYIKDYYKINHEETVEIAYYNQ